MHIGYPTSAESTLDLFLRMLHTGPSQPVFLSHSSLYHTLFYDVDCCGCILLVAWVLMSMTSSQIGGLGAVGTQTLGVDGMKFLKGFRLSDQMLKEASRPQPQS